MPFTADEPEDPLSGTFVDAATGLIGSWNRQDISCLYDDGSTLARYLTEMADELPAPRRWRASDETPPARLGNESDGWGMGGRGRAEERRGIRPWPLGGLPGACEEGRQRFSWHSRRTPHGSP
ncbi:hypothetical protein GCM10010294_69480 [Streptomyces griseoloalbus]|nr:hypothetical protein GCM10010294_69480 [Streptomyces griseoloalbus]